MEGSELGPSLAIQEVHYMHGLPIRSVSVADYTTVRLHSFVPNQAHNAKLGIGLERLGRERVTTDYRAGQHWNHPLFCRCNRLHTQQ